jgi:hypothetical protein
MLKEHPAGLELELKESVVMSNPGTAQALPSTI